MNMAQLIYLTFSTIQMLFKDLNLGIIPKTNVLIHQLQGRRRSSPSFDLWIGQRRSTKPYSWAAWPTAARQRHGGVDLELQQLEVRVGVEADADIMVYNGLCVYIYIYIVCIVITDISIIIFVIIIIIVVTLYKIHIYIYMYLYLSS